MIKGNHADGGVKMAQVIQVCRQGIPTMRFTGKKYAGFGHWGEWFANGWFDCIEQAMGGVDPVCRLWKDGGGYVGLERRKDGILLEYWIGMFTPPGTPVPEGFRFIDFPRSTLGVCWIYGKEADTHLATGACGEKLADAGLEIVVETDGTVWSFENCTCPRFTTPDEKGNVSLDYCYFVR